MPLPKNYTTKKAADYLSISIDTLDMLARKGKIVRYKISGNWRYNETDLDDYVRRQHEEGYMTAAKLRDGKKKSFDIRKYRQPEAISMKEVLREIERQEAKAQKEC